jgi:hypothetical protein
MRKRAACAKYLGHTIEYMEAMSVGDIQYPLKTQQSGAGQAKKGKSVWNTKFFADVNAMLNEPIDRFKMNLSRIDPHGDGKRCMLVPTRKTVEAMITVLKEQAEGEGIEADITPQTVKQALNAQGEGGEASWVAIFWKLYTGHEATLDEYVERGFSDLMQWLNAFHVLKPMTDEKAVESQLDFLVLGDAVVEDREEAAAYLYSCTCESYLHYAFCRHTCYILIESATVGYPATMSPSPSNPNQLVTNRDGRRVIGGGMKRKSKGGGALDRNG